MKVGGHQAYELAGFGVMFRQHVPLREDLLDTHTGLEGIVAGTKYIAVKTDIPPQRVVDRKNLNQVHIFNLNAIRQGVQILAVCLGVEADVGDALFLIGIDPRNLQTLQIAGRYNTIRQREKIFEGLFIFQLENSRTPDISGNSRDRTDTGDENRITRLQPDIPALVTF